METELVYAEQQRTESGSQEDVLLSDVSPDLICKQERRSFVR